MFAKKYAWLWTIYIVVVVVTFLVIECMAIATGGTTLSTYLWNLNQAWPLVFPAMTMCFGVFITHLSWHWMPPGAASQG